MTSPAPDATHDPPIPAAVRPQWDELLVAARRMLQAREEYETYRLQCHELSVYLLRAGIPPRDLAGRPFSLALLFRIKQREGLPHERRRKEATS